MSAAEIFIGSDGAATRAYYSQLESRGAIGVVAMNLFRAQKASARAKVYRGGIRGVGSFSRLAYDKKDFSLKVLCEALSNFADCLSIRFGWKVDPKMPGPAKWVLYVDLPQGQVSFHSMKKHSGPVYDGEWDGQPGFSAHRICLFCDSVFSQSAERSLFEETA